MGFARTRASGHAVRTKGGGRRHDESEDSSDEILDAKINASPRARARIVAALREGVTEFIISSIDGSVNARIHLSLAELATTEHAFPGGRMQIDWSRSTVAVEEACICLSRTELRLLAVLLDGEGKAMRRAELIARVWPQDQMTSSDRENALAVYVCNLRKRLTSIGAEDVLHTVRGVGYRLAVESSNASPRRHTGP